MKFGNGTAHLSHVGNLGLSISQQSRSERVPLVAVGDAACGTSGLHHSHTQSQRITWGGRGGRGLINELENRCIVNP